MHLDVATLLAATAGQGSTAFPWLSASILFPIGAALCIPFVPDNGDGDRNENRSEAKRRMEQFFRIEASVGMN